MPSSSFSALILVLVSASAIGEMPTVTESMAAQRVRDEMAFEKWFRMVMLFDM
jgi:hypothetical protein